MPNTKLKLKIIFLAIIFCGVFGLGANASAATYYVKNGGNDSLDGLSAETAWATVGKANSVNFASGDVLNFRPGDTFNDTNLKLLAVTGTISITIQGSDFGGRTISTNGKPKFDADVIDVQWNSEKSLSQPGAISINNDVIPGTINSVLIKDIQFEGQTTAYKNDWIAFYAVFNITIDGVDGNGAGGGNYTAGGNDGISIWYNTTATTGDIEIKNCHLQNLGPTAITSSPTEGVGDVFGIYLTNKSGGSVSVHDNLIHNINADAMQFRGVFGSCVTNIYNNEFYNCGENGVDIKANDNFNVFHNNIYRTPDFSGPGGVPGGQFPAIQMISNTEIDEHQSADNNNIYENYIHDLVGNGGSGVVVGAIVEGNYVTGNKVHHNWIENCYYGIRQLGGGINSQIYGNIVIDSEQYSYWENNAQTGNILSNNTFVNHASMGRGIFLESSIATVRNNIVYMTDSDDLAMYVTAGSPVVDYNIYYNATGGSQDIVYWKGTNYSETQQANWNAVSGHSHELFANPSLESIASNSLWAASESSPIVNSGISSAGQGYDEGLVYDSTWNPIFNVTLASGASNVIRDCGAYEFTSGDTTSPSVPQGLSVE